MRTLNVVFEDKEYKQLEKIKEKHGLNWHDFIMQKIGVENNENTKNI